MIGGAHSNNTRELVDTCSRYCGRVHHVQTAQDLCEEWFEGTNTVGLTAGTSTPDSVIDAVEKWLNVFAPRDTQEEGLNRVAADVRRRILSSEEISAD